jgi:hypothetical protein
MHRDKESIPEYDDEFVLLHSGGRYKRQKTRLRKESRTMSLSGEVHA